MNLLALHSELCVLRGGGENFTRNLLSVLAGRGHTVSAAFVAPISGPWPVALPDNIEAMPIRGVWNRKPGQAQLSRLERALPSNGRASVWLGRVKDGLDWRTAGWHGRRFQRRIRSELASRWPEFDAVFVHSDVDLAVEAASNRPTILRLPGPPSPDQAPLLERIQVVCANGDVLHRIRKLIGDRAVELPLGFDPSLFSPEGPTTRARLGWTERDFVIGYVGRLTRLKGSDLLAKAFRKFAENHPDARLLVIGSGEEEGELEYLLAEHLSSRRAQIVSGLDSHELGSWYRAMDAFVLPSRYENFSNALLEAVACGVPFVASDVGGNRMFPQIGCGELFELESVSNLVGRLHAFARDRDRMKRRALACAVKVQREFGWEATADVFEEILRSLRIAGVPGPCADGQGHQKLASTRVKP